MLLGLFAFQNPSKVGSSGSVGKLSKLDDEAPGNDGLTKGKTSDGVFIGSTHGPDAFGDTLYATGLPF
jgi:hypothetical protein